MYSYLDEMFKPYTIRPLAKALDAAIYDKDCERRKGETLLLYTDRKQRLFDDMLKADEPIELPDKMRGYLLIKHAHLNTNAHDTMTRWTENQLDWKTVFDNLRKLERPVPISGQSMFGSSHYNDDPTVAYCAYAQADGGTDWDSDSDMDSDCQVIEMDASLFVSPECFLAYDEILDQVIDDCRDGKYLWVPCDLGIDDPQGPLLEEPEAIAILANWGQARKYLLSAKLGRGYHKPKPPSSSGRPSRGAPNIRY